MIKMLIALAYVFTMSAHAATQEIRLLQQKGITGNMPLVYHAIPQFEKMAKERGHDVKIVLVPMANSSDAIVSMQSGKLEWIVSAMDTFLISNDRNPGKMKLLTATMEQNMDVICSNLNIKTAKDIKPTHRLALRTKGSSEHRVLMQLSKEIYGDYKALDTGIVTMPRPQISILMSSGQKDIIDCAVPGTPLQGSLVDAKHARQIYSVPGGNKHAAWASVEWIEKNPLLAELWIRALKQAGSDINQNPKTAFDHFRVTDAVSMTTEEIIDSFVQSRQTFVAGISSIQRQIDLLAGVGNINQKPDLKDILWRADLAK